MADLITLAEIKTYLNITDTTYDSKLSYLISAVSTKINTHCKRDFNKSTATEIVRFFSGSGFVNNTPLISITSLTHRNGTVYTVEDFIQQTGEIILEEKYFDNDYLTVVYEGGYEAIPEDLRLAATLYIEYLYNNVAGVKSMSIGEDKIDFEINENGIPNVVTAILDSYRHVRL